MGKVGTNLLFLTVGAAIGAVATYIATSEKREQWFYEAGQIVGKIKNTIRNKVEDIEEELEDLRDEE